MSITAGEIAESTLAFCGGDREEALELVRYQLDLAIRNKHPEQRIRELCEVLDILEGRAA